jgi:hypothetical protein
MEFSFPYHKKTLPDMIISHFKHLKGMSEAGFPTYKA